MIGPLGRKYAATELKQREKEENNDEA